MTIFTEHTWWYLARSSGIVAVTLLVFSVVWGIVLSTRLFPAVKPAWTLEVHKWLSGLAFCATSLHLLGLYLDGYIDFGMADLLLPGVSPYRPFAVAVGVLTLYAMVAIQVTSMARKHLSRRVWHGVHLLAYGAVWGGLLHAGTAGTDSANRAYQLLAAVLITITALAIAARVFARPRGVRAGRHQTPVEPTSIGRPARPTRRPGIPSGVVTAAGAGQISPALTVPTVTVGHSAGSSTPLIRRTPVARRLDPLIPPTPSSRRPRPRPR